LAEPVPYPVRLFIVEHVSSVGVLELLLLLRATPEKWWTAKELGRASVTSEDVAREHADHLVLHKLAVLEDDRYRYSPGDEDDVVDGLAEAYARRRHTVIGIIYGSESRQATTLANAFRFRRKKP
jgi:hypothetical protein